MDRSREQELRELVEMSRGTGRYAERLVLDFSAAESFLAAALRGEEPDANAGYALWQAEEARNRAMGIADDAAHVAECLPVAFGVSDPRDDASSPWRRYADPDHPVWGAGGFIR